MTVLLVAASPSRSSRSAALLQQVAQRLHARGVPTQTLAVRDLPASELLLARVDHPAIAEAVAWVAQAKAVVIATPVYKAAYSGLLKVFLDLLPQSAFRGQHVLPLATGGSPHHMLAVDYALRPVLQSLGAAHVLPGLYATDAQVQVQANGDVELQHDIEQRLDESINNLISEAALAPPPRAVSHAPVLFSQVRCSV